MTLGLSLSPGRRPCPVLGRRSLCLAVPAAQSTGPPPTGPAPVGLSWTLCPDWAFPSGFPFVSPDLEQHLVVEGTQSPSDEGCTITPHLKFVVSVGAAGYAEPSGFQRAVWWPRRPSWSPLSCLRVGWALRWPLGLGGPV